MMVSTLSGTFLQFGCLSCCEIYTCSFEHSNKSGSAARFSVPKVSLAPITGGYASVDALNSNFATIAAQLDLLLSRDGESPNTMLAALDMNSQRVLNVGAPVSGSDAVRKVDLADVLDESLQFTQVGTGAVPRTWAGKVGETYAITDFTTLAQAFAVGRRLHCPPGTYAITANTTAAAGTELVIEDGAVFTLRSNAVLDLSAATVHAAPNAEWIDAGGDYDDNGDGTFTFKHYEAAAIDGGRVKFNPSQTIYANWYMPGAVQTDGSASDIGDAFNTMTAGFRSQITSGTASTYPSLGIVGKHTSAVSLDATMLATNTEPPVVIYCDCEVLYAPAVAMKGFPGVDTCGSGFVRWVGTFRLLGDEDSEPDFGLSLARVDSATSHARCNNIAAFQISGYWAKAALMMNSAELNRADFLNVVNQFDSARSTVTLSRTTNFSTTTSRYRDVDSDGNSSNMGAQLNNWRVFYEGTEAFTSDVPDLAAICIEGPTYLDLHNCFVATNVPALHYKARTTSDPGNRITGFQQHQRNLALTQPFVAAVFESGAGTRIDDLMFEILKADATDESVRLVGTGQINGSTFLIRDGFGVLKSYGALTLRGVYIEALPSTASIDLSSCASVTGVIIVRDASIPVTLPATQNVEVLYRFPTAAVGVSTTSPRRSYNLVKERFVHAGITNSLSNSTFDVAGTSIPDVLQPRKGYVASLAVNFDAAISAGAVTNLTVMKIAADGTATGFITVTNPVFTNNIVHVSHFVPNVETFSATDRLRVRITTDASLAGPTEAVATLTLVVEG